MPITSTRNSIIKDGKRYENNFNSFIRGSYHSDDMFGQWGIILAEFSQKSAICISRNRVIFNVVCTINQCYCNKYGASSSWE